MTSTSGISVAAAAPTQFAIRWNVECDAHMRVSSALAVERQVQPLFGDQDVCHRQGPARPREIG